jgi:hypothetical protein
MNHLARALFAPPLRGHDLGEARAPANAAAGGAGAAPEGSMAFFKKTDDGANFLLHRREMSVSNEITTHSHVPMALVVMQRRNASFLAEPVTVGRSREGGRYGCYTTQGRSALA